MGAVRLQALTPEEEGCLVDYIRRLSLLSLPPQPSLVLETAEHLRNNCLLINTPLPANPIPSLGSNWLQKFRKHHPSQIDTSRLDGSCPEKLAVWFAEMASILHQNSYNPADIYNKDETGYAIGATQSTRVLAVLEKEKLARKGAPGRQEWVTSIDCVSAAGRALPPSAIFTSLHPGRVAKADWCSNVVPARLKAMTEANTRARWRSTGLYPSQPSRVIPDVPVPSTPPRQGSRLSQTPLASNHTRKPRVPDSIWRYHPYPSQKPIAGAVLCF